MPSGARDLRPILVRDPSELESAILAGADDGIAALEAADQPMFNSKAGHVAMASVCLQRRLPSIGSLGFARNGGLLGYGVSFPDMYRRADVFVDKILKGAKPGDIPIEQATKFETIVNLRTAKDIGADMPPLVLAAADEVIE